MRRTSGTIVVFLACASAVALVGCGQKASAPAPTGTPIGAAAADAEAEAAAAAKAAELAAREQDLAEREATLKAQEADKAKQEAEAAAAAASAAAQKAAASKPAVRPASTTASSKAPAPAPAPAPTPIVVPAGTQLAVALAQNVNTKKVLMGAPVQGTLASDVVVGGRRAAKAGAAVHGTVTQVVSGSDKIGGVPTIGLRFDTLVAADGSTRTINASYLQQSTSETGRDTAKIVGGAAAGAIIGHQVDDDKGTVIGGLLGAGAGAAAAQKTGGDIKLAAGQVLEVATTTGFEVKP